MLYRLLLLLSVVSSLHAKEFRIITLQHNPNLGMFAAANQVLGQLYMFEKGLLPQVSGLEVNFGKNGLYYDSSQGPNWWSYFFEPVCIGEKRHATVVYPSREQCLEAWLQRRLMTRENAAHIIKKHVHIKPHIQEKIDEFVHHYFKDSFMIGVHYRGTDKQKEAPKIDFETIFEEIERHIPNEKPCRLFIATDEIDFLEQAKARFNNQVIAIEAHRVESGGVGAHFVNKNNYSLGEEALMDAYLLSKCDLLIRTSSNLSLWSTYFNPDLPVVLLNQRFMQTLEPE